jgi:dimethylhistidine N-methyltransferase
MATTLDLQVSEFAADVWAGLTAGNQKKLCPKYFYDELGSKLFEAITLLPEYGLSRADERLLARCAASVAARLHYPCLVAELGSGSGKKTSHILKAIDVPGLKYYPIDVSIEALSACKRELRKLAAVEAINGDYFQGLECLGRKRPDNAQLLLLFLGSTIGNLERSEQHDFLREVHSRLRPGDLFLVGADLVKGVDRMLAAYDDPTNVTAAFNLNLLARMNRELQADFDLRCFVHQAVWNRAERRIEMHLISREEQDVHVGASDLTVHFRAGESIWTESSHKFTMEELDALAGAAGFEVLDSWSDSEWPFAETLWRA